ncbi:GNAT family N-acetyltransferase [Clostridium sp.]|uniref:GNAT family N-acetyltransferase n=1 Tax=Clostridium sp. TaxID=1506 RepID=UPI002FCADC7D
MLNHIALSFVDGKHHRQGIGKKLFQIVLENSTAKEITVNSTPYAVEVYNRLGFVDIASEETTKEI